MEFILGILFGVVSLFVTRFVDVVISAIAAIAAAYLMNRAREAALA